MIIFDDVNKAIRSRGMPEREMLSSVSAAIPSNRRIALLGVHNDEKLALIDLLAGISLPTSGRIIRNCRVSFPVGFLAAFEPELTPRHNVEHAALLYGLDPRPIIEFVDRMANIGEAFDKPFSEVHSRFRRRLGLILAFAMPFDVYVMKGDLTRVKADPTYDFKSVAYELFEARARTAGMVIATSNYGFATEYCELALLLSRGRLLAFDSIDAAFGEFEQLKSEELARLAAVQSA